MDKTFGCFVQTDQSEVVTTCSATLPVSISVDISHNAPPCVTILLSEQDQPVVKTTTTLTPADVFCCNYPRINSFYNLHTSSFTNKGRLMGFEIWYTCKTDWKCSLVIKIDEWYFRAGMLAKINGDWPNPEVLRAQISRITKNGFYRSRNVCNSSATLFFVCLVGWVVNWLVGWLGFLLKGWGWNLSNPDWMRELNV